MSVFRFVFHEDVSKINTKASPRNRFLTRSEQFFLDPGKYLDETLFPTMKEKRCSFQYLDARRGVSHITMKESANYIKELKFAGVTDKFPKYLFCFLIYILQCIDIIGDITDEIKSITVFNFYYGKQIESNSSHNTLKALIQSRIIEIVNILLKFHKNHDASLYDAFIVLFDDIEDFIPKEVQAKIDTIKNVLIRGNIGDLTIKELYDIEYNGCSYPSVLRTNVDDSIVERLRAFLEEKKVPSLIDDDGKLRKDINIVEELLKLNVKLCDTVKEVQAVKPFNQMTMNSLNEYLNIEGKGHCFTYEYLLWKMLKNEGILQLDGIQYKHKEMASLLAKYYFYVSQNNDKYGVEETSFLDVQKKFRDLMDPSSDSHVSKDLERFKKIYDRSMGTYFDLIGLLGYILRSENLDVKALLSDNSHPISYACFRKFMEISRASPDIPLHVTGVSIMLDKPFILQRENDTTSHAIGLLFLKYYIASLHLKERYLLQLKERIDDNILKSYGFLGDSESKLEFLDECFRSPRFLIPAPPELNEYGIIYLTCIRVDTLNTMAPLNEIHHVYGYTKEAEEKLLFYISITYDTPINIMRAIECTQNRQITLIKPHDNEAIHEAYLRYYETRMDLKEGLELLNIVETFQRDRIPTFNTLAGHMQHMVHCSSDKPCIFSQKEKLLDQSLRLTDDEIPNRFLSVIRFPEGGDEEYKHMYANHERFYKPEDYSESDAEIRHYANSLSYIAKLKYKLTSRTTYAIPIPELPQHDISRPVEYSRLLAKIYYPRDNIIYDTVQSYFSAFESYFNAVLNTKMIINDSMFANFKFTKPDNNKIPIVRYKRMSNKQLLYDEYCVSMDESLKKEAMFVIKDIFKIFDTINLMNACGKIKVLISYYRTHEYVRKFFGKDIQDIVTRLRTFLMFIIHVCTVVVSQNPPYMRNMFKLPQWIINAHLVHLNNSDLNTLNIEELDNAHNNILIFMIRMFTHNMLFEFDFPFISEDIYKYKVIQNRDPDLEPASRLNYMSRKNSIRELLTDLIPYYETAKDIEETVVIKELTRVELLFKHGAYMRLFGGIDYILSFIYRTCNHDKIKNILESTNRTNYGINFNALMNIYYSIGVRDYGLDFDGVIEYIQDVEIYGDNLMKSIESLNDEWAQVMRQSITDSIVKQLKVMYTENKLNLGLYDYATVEAIKDEFKEFNSVIEYHKTHFSGGSRKPKNKKLKKKVLKGKPHK